MPKPLYGLLAETILFVDTVEHNEHLRSGLESGGYTSQTHQRGRELIAEALAEIDFAVEQYQTDETISHLVHAAATEVEMWMETAKYRAGKAVGDDEAALALMLGRDVHRDDHTLTVIAQVLRYVSMVRMDEEVRGEMGSQRSVEDLLMRGLVLLRKLLRLTDGMILPSGEAREHLEPVRKNLLSWVKDARASAESAFSAEPRTLALLGCVTDEHAMPLGGTGYSITRHEKGQRDTPPGEQPAGPAPGWSVGRQGRNRENAGKGFH